MMRLIEFECGGQRLGLPLDCVRRAVPSAEPVPLPGAGPIVLGVLNVAGEMVAVVDVRQAEAAAPLDPSQQILIAQLSGFLAGIVVDRIQGVTERDAARLFPAEVGAAPYVRGMVRLEDGLCLVVEPSRFLFDDERAALGVALDAVTPGGADEPA